MNPPQKNLHKYKFYTLSDYITAQALKRPRDSIFVVELVLAIQNVHVLVEIWVIAIGESIVAQNYSLIDILEWQMYDPMMY